MPTPNMARYIALSYLQKKGGRGGDVSLFNVFDLEVGLERGNFVGGRGMIHCRKREGSYHAWVVVFVELVNKLLLV